MGIELPQPRGEASQSLPHVENHLQPGLPEVRTNVEPNATESPAYQEVRTNQPAGGQANQSNNLVAINTTQSTTTATTASAPLMLDDVPVIAADEDLIEKQWVDSVKRVIKETRSDPYSQGRAISRLQADYLQKRYGKTLGGSDDV